MTQAVKRWFLNVSIPAASVYPLLTSHFLSPHVKKKVELVLHAVHSGAHPALSLEGTFPLLPGCGEWKSLPSAQSG